MVQKTKEGAANDSPPRPARPPRGRPRAYDTDKALKQATEAFWQAGYSGTSLDALSAATGMNRPSLYGAFGDKRALYLTTLDRYISTGRDLMEQALGYDLPLPEALSHFYDRALAFYRPTEGAARGCFLLSTAATDAAGDHDVRAKLRDGLQEFDRAFEARLKHAQALGELDATADTATLARIASAIQHTLAMRSRAGDSLASLRATAGAGVQMICWHVSAARARPKPPRRARPEKGATLD